MNALAETYAGEDFVILAFPCNIFGLLEPGSGYDEIMNGITYVRPGGGFIPNITLFEKIEVNGDNEHPLYTWLKSYCSYCDTTYKTDLFYTPQRIGDIYWNFEKFLIGRDGKPYTRYHPKTSEAIALHPDINHLLEQPVPSMY
ncbi:UNVERIFIED_CONTAM: hypothetical protein GTU68_064062 [Idotea baltica]|nr:hypothetical protein [Idotea baltica]